MNDFLAFRRMVTPIVIQVVFWLGLVACVVVGLGSVVAGATSSYGGGWMVLWGFFMLLVGPLVVRIYCELLIVLFGIHSTLADIKNALTKK